MIAARRVDAVLYQSFGGVPNGAITESVVYPNNINHDKRHNTPFYSTAFKFHMWTNGFAKPFMWMMEMVFESQSAETLCLF